MNFRELCIAENNTLFMALRKINDTGYGTLFVVDEKMRMLGLITDGDIRRGLLAGADLQGPVTLIMNTKFTAGSQGQDRRSMLQALRRNHLRQLPVLDGDGVLVDAVLLDEALYGSIPNSVVLMVGGMGTRLRPLTDQTPKPMVRVGNKPILEDILQRLIYCGFKHFYFAVNYKAEMIEAHFGDGAQWDVTIDYLREEARLGTAGALSLLPTMTKPFLVMNGDLLTDMDFADLLRFHESEGGIATVSVCQQQMQVQFGVVEFENARVTRIAEKPFHVFFINAGVYVINPEALTMVQSGTYQDMPTLIAQMIDAQKSVSAFSVQGYWKDIGVITDLDQARRDFKKIG